MQGQNLLFSHQYLFSIICPDKKIYIRDTKTSNNSLSERKSTLPESLICNQPESVYQSLISTSKSCSSSSKSSSSSSSSKDKTSPSYDEISQYRDFYTTPVSALDPATYSKYKTVRSMVVSQTWLTGWIKELYDIESNIVSATGKSLS